MKNFARKTQVKSVRQQCGTTSCLRNAASLVPTVGEEYLAVNWIQFPIYANSRTWGEKKKNNHNNNSNNKNTTTKGDTTKVHTSTVPWLVLRAGRSNKSYASALAVALHNSTGIGLFVLLAWNMILCAFAFLFTFYVVALAVLRGACFPRNLRDLRDFAIFKCMQSFWTFMSDVFAIFSFAAERISKI